MRYTFLLPDENATLALGEKIAQNLKGGAFIALQGGLGAGKTVLVKGLAHGLKITQRVMSPTFPIMCQYFGTRELCHFDLYRITEDDCYDMGFDDFFFDPSIICAVEWSERLHDLPPHTLIVKLSVNDDGSRQAEIIDENGLLKGDI
jgi:hydrolase, P-loop family